MSGGMLWPMLLLAATGVPLTVREAQDREPEPPRPRPPMPDELAEERLAESLAALERHREARAIQREAWRIEWLRRRPLRNVRSDGHDEARLTEAAAKRERRRQRRLRERR